jgi:hypothetical protein
VSNVVGFDPADDRIVALFDPRKDVWQDHFEVRGASIVGKTPVGRTTVLVLNMNSEQRLELRAVRPFE